MKTARPFDPLVSFKKVERVCPYNESVRAKKPDYTRLIYDFEVWFNGEHRATWVNNHGHRDYELRTPSRKQAIFWQKPTHPEQRWHIIVAKSQVEFNKVINLAIEKRRLPTLAQLAELDRSLEQYHLDQQAEAKETFRIQRIRQAGPALLDALDALLADWKGKVLMRDPDIADWSTQPLAAAAQEAIDLATKEPMQEEDKPEAEEEA